MNITTEEMKAEFPNMLRVFELSSYTDGGVIRTMFPNTIWERGGLARFASCIGFLRGMFAAGKPMEDVEKLAETLFRSFSFGMSDERQEVYREDRPAMNEPEHMRPHNRKLIVSDDGSFLSFSFLLVHLIPTSESGNLGWTTELPGYSEYSKKYKYAKSFNGGIIFHGLGQNFSVQIGGGVGWSMHT